MSECLPRGMKIYPQITQINTDFLIRVIRANPCTKVIFVGVDYASSQFIRRSSSLV